jgi:hypothetical protein
MRVEVLVKHVLEKTPLPGNLAYPNAQREPRDMEDFIETIDFSARDYSYPVCNMKTEIVSCKKIDEVHTCT